MLLGASTEVFKETAESSDVPGIFKSIFMQYSERSTSLRDLITKQANHGEAK
jgi:hypothetical protein